MNASRICLQKLTGHTRRAFAVGLYLTLAFGQTAFSGHMGDLDPTFGVSGKVLDTNYSVNLMGVIQALLIQPDGKILACGGGYGAGDDTTVLARYNSDGSLDSTFGGGSGKIVNPGRKQIKAMVLQPDGKIVAIRRSWNSALTSELARYNTDGSLDAEISDAMRFYGVARQPDGKIVVAGDYTVFRVARYNADLTPDVSFGGGSGKVTIGQYFRAMGVAIQPDGKIVAVGESDGDFAMARFKTDGSLDTTFGGGSGKVLTDMDTSYDCAQTVALQPDGKIVVLGYYTPITGGGPFVALARYNSNGSLDTSFGGGTGKVMTWGIYTGDGDYKGVGNSLALQPDGKILVAGIDYSTTDSFAVVRYNSNGTLDTTFGFYGDGIVITDFGDNAEAYGVALQQDGKIVLAGTAAIYPSLYFALARYMGLPADLSITKSASPSSVFPGSNITYTLAVTNYGPASVTNVVVFDALPATTTYLSSTATGGGVCTNSGNNVTVRFPSMASNGTASITLIAQVNASVAFGARITNAATIDSDIADLGRANNSSTGIVTVIGGPFITSTNAAWFRVGFANWFSVTTAGYPTPSVTRSGTLPTGLTFSDNGDGTATFSGTPAGGTGGVYPLAMTAHNGIGTDVVQSLTLTVNQASAITSATSTSFRVGTSGSFTITTTGFPTPTVGRSGTLPSGVTFTNNGNGTGTLSGTPAAGTGGVYPLTITATNGVGSASQSFALTVNQPSAITTATSTNFMAGTSGSFTIRTTGYPKPTFTLSGALPGGVSFTDNANGTATLGGTPAAGSGGVYNFTITARNGIGSDSVQNFALTVQQAPAITSVNSATFTSGQAGSFTVTATGFPKPTLTQSGALPSAVTFVDNGDGTATLSGTPPTGTGGVYTLVLTAQNGIGTNASQNFTLTVQQIGSLQVTIQPAEVVAGGGMWRIAGTTNWQNTASMVTNVLIGPRTVEFKPVAEWLTPTNQNVTIYDGLTTGATGTYTKIGITTPGNGSTFNSSSVTFTWNPFAGASQYALWVGTTPGGYNLKGIALTGLSYTVSGLPANGSQIYARLWALVNGAWQQVNDYTYTAATAVKAKMLTPANGTTNTSATVTFTWDAGVGVSMYALWIGSTVGGWDLYAAATTAQSLTATLPTDGRPLYTRLMSYMNGGWQWNDYTYTAYTSPIAQMMTPAPGATLTGDRVDFQWACVPGVTYYALYVGTTGAGSYNLYAAVETGQSRVVKVPTNGSTVYVRLWTYTSGQWRWNDYTYTAYGSSVPTKALLSGPAPGATLTGDRVNIEWSSGVGAGYYALWVGTAPDSNNLYAGVETGLSRIVRVQANGTTIYVKLWSWVNGGWQTDTRTCTACNKGPEAVAMQTPTPGSTLTGAVTRFTWSSGVSVGYTAMWVGTTPNGYDVYAGVEYGLSRILTLPTNGQTLYVTLWSYINGAWQSNAYTYTAAGP